MQVPPLTDDDRRAYAADVATVGGAKACFSRLATACLERFLSYGAGGKRSKEEIIGWAEVIYDKVSAMGWPQPLASGQVVAAADRVLPNLESWVKDVLSEVGSVFEDEAEKRRVQAGLQQLFKACLYPEFTECRDSYRQVSASGVCKRQQLTIARERVSGVACVDCPYTVLVPMDTHRRLVKKSWAITNPEAFETDPMCFLPEDFRHLRRFLWLHVRIR